MEKIYFAHCMADYNTARERVALGLIERRFPDWQIINPHAYAEDYKRWLARLADHHNRPMEFWTDLVRECDALVFMFTGEQANFYLSAGVAQEVLSAHVAEKPVFQISITEHQFGGVYAALDTSTVFQDVLSIEETRELLVRPPTAEAAAMRAQDYAEVAKW